MFITYDSQADALYIRFSQKEGSQVITKRIDEDIALDFEEGEKLHGIEILAASHRLDLDAVLKVYVPLADASQR